MGVTAKIDRQKGTLTLTLPLDENGRPSTSGKTIVHASTHGNTPTNQTIGDQPLIVGVNAYTKAPAKPTQ